MPVVVIVKGKFLSNTVVPSPCILTASLASPDDPSAAVEIPNDISPWGIAPLLAPVSECM